MPPTSSWQLPIHATCQLHSVPGRSVAYGDQPEWEPPGGEGWSRSPRSLADNIRLVDVLVRASPRLRCLSCSLFPRVEERALICLIRGGSLPVLSNDYFSLHLCLCVAFVLCEVFHTHTPPPTLPPTTTKKHSRVTSLDI